jgi:hypothetical protein
MYTEFPKKLLVPAAVIFETQQPRPIVIPGVD